MDSIAWRLIVSMAILEGLSIMFPQCNKAVGLCTSASLTRDVGYILRGFLVAEVRVRDETECRMRCAYTANCLSLNILTEPDDGGILCQLNSGLKQHATHEQFVPHAAGEYNSVTEKKVCADNGKTCNSVTLWHAFNQSYFKFVASKLNFDDALLYCRAEKGDLASFSSEEQQTFLFESFVKGNPDVDDSVWVGLNDKAKEGELAWTDGSPVSYARFHARQPDDYGTGEDCIALYADDGGLNDIPCYLKRPFICKTNFNPLYQ